MQTWALGIGQRSTITKPGEAAGDGGSAHITLGANQTHTHMRGRTTHTEHSALGACLSCLLPARPHVTAGGRAGCSCTKVVSRHRVNDWGRCCMREASCRAAERCLLGEPARQGHSAPCSRAAAWYGRGDLICKLRRPAALHCGPAHRHPGPQPSAAGACHPSTHNNWTPADKGTRGAQLL